jgi:Transposase DDE domain
LVLYDVTTLYFEAENEDALRKVGMSKERRVDPQIQVGLLVDPSGFPLEVSCFEGNTAETTTLLPVLRGFAERHQVSDMVVVANAGMLSAANLNALEDAKFSFIVGSADQQGPRRLGRALRTPRQRLHRRAVPRIIAGHGHREGRPVPAGGLSLPVRPA